MTDSTAAAAAAPRSAQSTVNTFWSRSMIGLGLVMIGFWLLALVTQIQTNEAFMLSSGIVNVFKPNWLILMQPVNLMTGTLNPSDAQADFIGWIIELIYLAFVAGYEIITHGVKSRSGLKMAGIFIKLSWLIVLFNGWADCNYGTVGTGILGHIMFATIMSFVVGFFGTVGVSLIEHGWKQA